MGVQDAVFTKGLANRLATECRMYSHQYADWCKKQGVIALQNSPESFVWEGANCNLFVLVHGDSITLFGDRQFRKVLRKFDLSNPASIENLRDFICRRNSR